jgi:hypothetical protein
MRSSLVEIGDVFTHDSSQMTFIQDKHIVQAFAAQAAQEPLAKRVRARRFHWGFQQVNIRPIDHMLKLLTILLIIRLYRK